MKTKLRDHPFLLVDQGASIWPLFGCEPAAAKVQSRLARSADCVKLEPMTQFHQNVFCSIEYEGATVVGRIFLNQRPPARSLLSSEATLRGTITSIEDLELDLSTDTMLSSAA